jgi:hypothetical protein
LSWSHCRREQCSFVILVLADPCDSEQGRSSMNACEWERSCSCILGKLKKQVRCVSALAFRPPRLGAVGHVAGSGTALPHITALGYSLHLVNNHFNSQRKSSCIEAASVIIAVKTHFTVARNVRGTDTLRTSTLATYYAMRTWSINPQSPTATLSFLVVCPALEPCWHEGCTGSFSFLSQALSHGPHVPCGLDHIFSLASLLPCYCWVACVLLGG